MAETVYGENSENVVKNIDYGIDEINRRLKDVDNKVDKVSGKSLVSDSEIERLADVSNYDDTALKADVEDLKPIKGNVANPDNTLLNNWSESYIVANGVTTLAVEATTAKDISATDYVSIGNIIGGDYTPKSLLPVMVFALASSTYKYVNGWVDTNGELRIIPTETIPSGTSIRIATSFINNQ